MSRIGPVASSATAGFTANPYPASAVPAVGPQSQEQRRRRRPKDWHEAVAELEGEVLAAERTMAEGRADEIAAWGRRSSDWIPPTGLGPLPEDLRERAMRLLQQQLAVAEALVERITQSQKQRELAARMSYGPVRPVASFIDRGL
jgi:hypothetical protein